MTRMLCPSGSKLPNNLVATLGPTTITRDAVRTIADGIERQARVVEFPFGMSVLMRMLRLVPGPVFDRLVRPWARRKIDVERARH